MQVKNNNLKDGIDNLLKALSLENNNQELLIKIGEAYLMFEKDEGVDEAIVYLSSALKIDENNYDCLIGLAKAYEKKNDVEKAV